MSVQVLMMIIAVIAGVALHDFRKRKHDVFDTVQAKKHHQRTIRKIEVTLAGSVIVLALLFVYQPDFSQETQAGDQGVQTATESKEYPEGVYGPGTYKVGTDIDAGEYKLTAESEDKPAGYYELKDGSGSDAQILSNSLFESNEYVTVSEGEYLTVNRATFELVKVQGTIQKNEENTTDTKDATETPREEPASYFFEDENQEAEFFKSIALTVDQGRETMNDTSSLSYMCGKVCPDIPGDTWALQLEPMNNDMFNLQRYLSDFAEDLRAIPEGSSPNINFEERDELVAEFERTAELITPIMTKTDWPTWEDGWDTIKEAQALLEEMHVGDVYTVPTIN